MVKSKVSTDGKPFGVPFEVSDMDNDCVKTTVSVKITKGSCREQTEALYICCARVAWKKRVCVVG